MSPSVMLLSLVVLAGILLVIYFVWSQYRKTPPPTRKRPDKTAAASARQIPTGATLHPFRSTALKPGKDACSAVVELSGKRFLVDGGVIPSLPLPECDSSNCTCRYVKYRDRRDIDGDRRAIGGMHRSLVAQVDDGERREGSERRDEEDE